jgi:hypothetical protein
MKLLHYPTRLTRGRCSSPLQKEVSATARICALPSGARRSPISITAPSRLPVPLLLDGEQAFTRSWHHRRLLRHGTSGPPVLRSRSSQITSPRLALARTPSIASAAAVSAGPILLSRGRRESRPSNPEHRESARSALAVVDTVSFPQFSGGRGRRSSSGRRCRWRTCHQCQPSPALSGLPSPTLRWPNVARAGTGDDRPNRASALAECAKSPSPPGLQAFRKNVFRASLNVRWSAALRDRAVVNMKDSSAVAPTFLAGRCCCSPSTTAAGLATHRVGTRRDAGARSVAAGGRSRVMRFARDHALQRGRARSGARRREGRSSSASRPGPPASIYDVERQRRSGHRPGSGERCSSADSPGYSGVGRGPRLSTLRRGRSAAQIRARPDCAFMTRGWPSRVDERWLPRIDAEQRRRRRNTRRGKTRALSYASILDKPSTAAEYVHSGCTDRSLGVLHEEPARDRRISALNGCGGCGCRGELPRRRVAETAAGCEGPRTPRRRLDTYTSVNVRRPRTQAQQIRGLKAGCPI